MITDMSLLKTICDHTCNKLTVYESKPENPYPARWFYSKDVPEKPRLAIDQDISKLFEKGKVKELL